MASNKKDLAGRFIQFLVQTILHRWRTVFILTLSLLVVCGWGIKNIQFDSDYKKFLSESEQAALDEFDRTYTKEMSLMFAVSAKNGSLFTAGNLSALEELTNQSWKIPYVLRVDSLTNFQNTTARGEDLVVRDLVKGAQRMSAEEISQAKSVAMADPRIIKRLLSENGQHAIVLINLNLVEKDYEKLETSIMTARGFAAEISKKNPDLEIRTTGGAVISWGVRQIALEDTLHNVPMMNLFLFLVLLFFLRSFKSVLTVFSVIVSSILTALGICAWRDIAISNISAMAPTIIMTLAVADSVHVLITFQRYLLLGLTKVEAIKNSLEHNIKPMFLTCLTTFVGFITMNLSDSPNYREFGNIVAIGVVFAFLFTCTLLPSIIMLVPSQNWGQHRISRESQFSQKVLNLRWLGQWVIKNSKLCLSIWLVGFVFLAAMIPNNRVDEDFMKLIDRKQQLRQDTDFVSRNIVGFHTMQYHMKANEADRVKDPEYLKFLDNFSKWLGEQKKEVQQVVSMADVIKNLNQVMHGNNPDYYVIPENQNLVAQYLLLYELALPQGLDLTNMINADKSASRLIVGLNNLTNNELVNFADRTQTWLKTNAPKFMVSTHDAGAALAFSRVTIDNIWSMIKGELITIAVICLLMAILFRPMIVGFISIFPNFMPAICGLGLWGITYQEVGMAASSVFGLTLGIAIDDTIHFLSHYIDARRLEGLTSKEALLKSFEESAPSVLATSVILMAGFGVMILSRLNMNMHFGILTVWIFFFAMLGDYFLLGPLLLMFDKKTYK